ncbi:MAG: glycosyltransferase family 4 protein [Candidatus Saccharimonadia bacterium]
MTIVIDGRMASWTGIGRYTVRLVTGLAEIDKSNQYVILHMTKDRDLFRNLGINFRLQAADIEPYGPYEQLQLPKILTKLAPELVHFPHFTVPPWYKGRYVVTIHDLTLIDYKTNRGNGPSRVKFESKHTFMRFVIRRAIKRATSVITDSNYVREDILARYHEPNLAKKIQTIYLGVDTFSTSAKDSLAELDGQPFLLYVGNYYPNKNISRLVDAFGLLRQDFPTIKLVLVGQRDYFLNKIAEQADKIGGGQVIVTGRVPDSQLAWLYQNAQAFVFPSLAEGFGLPPLEAMALGTPVISSNSSCLPEVLGEAAVYFDPTNSAQMAKVIIDTLHNPKLLSDLGQRGRNQVKQFSWQKMTEQTLAVYRKSL